LAKVCVRFKQPTLSPSYWAKFQSRVLLVLTRRKSEKFYTNPVKRGRKTRG
jgi:hypothetical protein